VRVLRAERDPPALAVALRLPSLATTPMNTTATSAITSPITTSTSTVLTAFLPPKRGPPWPLLV
jgi:hypothetical protein